MNNNTFSKKIMYILKDIYKKLRPQLPNLPNNIIILDETKFAKSPNETP